MRDVIINRNVIESFSNTRMHWGKPEKNALIKCEQFLIGACRAPRAALISALCPSYLLNPIRAQHRIDSKVSTDLKVCREAYLSQNGPRIALTIFIGHIEVSHKLSILTLEEERGFILLRIASMSPTAWHTSEIIHVPWNRLRSDYERFANGTRIFLVASHTRFTFFDSPRHARLHFYFAIIVSITIIFSRPICTCNRHAKSGFRKRGKTESRA